MQSILTPLDIFVFFGSLVAIMAIGIWVGRKEETSDDYFLAGKSTRWWGVAGSIFGSNVSANHIVGMMGVGFSVGFAQSHFEISAIAGLLLLCYGFLPVYRKLNIYTLSEYLSQRYNDSCRLAYAAIMITIIVVIQMVPGFYIGSRSINALLSKRQPAKLVAERAQNNITVEIVDPGLGYELPPTVTLSERKVDEDGKPSNLELPEVLVSTEVRDGSISRLVVAGEAPGKDQPLVVSIKGGIREDSELTPGEVDPTYYRWGVILMALITGTYTIVGGLKAVIVTDVIQSVLLLVAGLIVAFLTFNELGGWGEMVRLDSAPDGAGRLHLYNPPNHPKLPWTGVISGLMVLHFFYWGTNQFIVQRALAARSDAEARYGILAAGFLKLLIPFFSIGTGIAAYYLFSMRGEAQQVDQDAVFTRLLTDSVAPIGFGLVGIVAAGMIGAILSSLDSLMNSASTILVFDVYKRFINPKASERRLILYGRLFIVVFIVGSAGLTLLTADPNSKDSFFLQIAEHQSKLVAGVVVAFGLGMLWRGATAAGALVAIVVGILVSYLLPVWYALDSFPSKEKIVPIFGEKLNFMHSVFVAAVLAAISHVVVSLLTPTDKKKGELTWVGLKIFKPATLRRFAMMFGGALVIYIVLALMMINQVIPSTVAAFAGLLVTWSAFAIAAWRGQHHKEGQGLSRLLVNDRFWAGLLAGLAIFMMYFFY